MPRIARGGVGGAAHGRSGPSAFELAFPPTPGLLFPPLISDMASRLGQASVTYENVGQKTKFDPNSTSSCIPSSFPPPLFFPLSDLLPWPPFRQEADHQPPFVISYSGRDDSTSQILGSHLPPPSPQPFPHSSLSPVKSAGGCRRLLEKRVLDFYDDSLVVFQK